MKSFHITLSALMLSLIVLACSKESVTTLRLESSSELSFDAKGGEASITFFSSDSWTAMSSSPWCSVSKTSGSKGNNTISITCAENSSNSVREGTVTISAKDVYVVVRISQEERKPEPISPLIYGRWVLKKGQPTGFLSPSQFSHIISFNASGNYEETCYTSTMDSASGLNTYWTSSSLTGNWKGGDNKILLNDWDGNNLKDTLYLVSIAPTELKLRFKDINLTYCKEDSQFANLKAELTGRWYSITTLSYKGYYILNADGTASINQYEKFFSSYLSRGFAGTWWVESSDLVLHDSNAASGYNYNYPIYFINNKFVGFKSLVLEKR